MNLFDFSRDPSLIQQEAFLAFKILILSSCSYFQTNAGSSVRAAIRIFSLDRRGAQLVASDQALSKTSI